MTALPIVKITKAGESLTLNVMACSKVPVGQYPEVEFSGIDIDSKTATAVRVPESSANRQLARLNLTYADCVGKTLRISRDPNAAAPSKPYWGISVTQDSAPTVAKQNGATVRGIDIGHIPGLDEPPPPDDRDHPDAPPPAAPLSNGKLAASFKLYDECFDHALTLTQRAVGQGLKVDTAAMAATLFIQANR